MGKEEERRPNGQRLFDDDRRRIPGVRFLIDANRINSSGRLQHMNILERWHRDKVISIMMAQSAQVEAAFGNCDRARKAYRYIFTLTKARPEDHALQNAIENILFPHGATTQNQKSDIDIVFNARKYVCQLITNDGGSRRQPGGILGNRDRLLQLGIVVLTDEEAVMQIKQRIQERDSLERARCNINGQPLPNWVGRD